MDSIGFKRWKVRGATASCCGSSFLRCSRKLLCTSSRGRPDTSHDRGWGLQGSSEVTFWGLVICAAREKLRWQLRRNARSSSRSLTIEEEVVDIKNHFALAVSMFPNSLCILRSGWSQWLTSVWVKSSHESRAAAWPSVICSKAHGRMLVSSSWRSQFLCYQHCIPW